MGETPEQQLAKARADVTTDDVRLAALEARIPVVDAVRDITGHELTEEQAEQIARACIAEGLVRGHLLTHTAWVYYRCKDHNRVERETRGRVEREMRREATDG